MALFNKTEEIIIIFIIIIIVIIIIIIKTDTLCSIRLLVSATNKHQNKLHIVKNRNESTVLVNNAYSKKWNALLDL
jgi:predicted Holliday junction resolvase-like endonuclease